MTLSRAAPLLASASTGDASTRLIIISNVRSAAAISTRAIEPTAIGGKSLVHKSERVTRPHARELDGLLWTRAPCARQSRSACFRPSLQRTAIFAGYRISQCQDRLDSAPVAGSETSSKNRGWIRTLIRGCLWGFRGRRRLLVNTTAASTPPMVRDLVDSGRCIEWPT